ncbi:MAG: hypothetical protein CME65_04620 [Halobacteriovoraceae bacterium]|nr:hypothetical protein [Halobacteriovoraceae bacterium]|tara:strand:+ start:8967 stop:9854 length:888 start_codon:yes stop_codon:yes gene_type:complete
MPKICKLKPFINEKIWGGDKLKSLRNISAKNPIGETWEVSSLAEGKSLNADTNKPINLNLSYIVKYIDTASNLSIQVHPDDAYAKEFENSLGKTECWLILDHEPEAGIYLGFKKGVTKKEFLNAAKSGLSCDQFLNFIPVSRGDFFKLPPGTVHAIGKGVTLCEVQQNSSVTYRVWDWNRLGFDGKPRELHLEKAMDVLVFDPIKNDQLLHSQKRDLFDIAGIVSLINHRDFRAELFNNFTKTELEINLNAGDSIVLLEGEMEDLNPLDCALAVESGTYLLEVKKSSSFLIVTGK